MDVHSPRISVFGDGTPQWETLARRINGHKGASFITLAETDLTFGQGKDGEIAAQANVISRMPFGAALADNDIARNDLLTTELFDAKALAG